MAFYSLSETEEAEAFAWNLGNLEVRSRVLAVQVVATIIFRPRGPKTSDDTIQDLRDTTSLSNSRESRAAL